MSAGVGCAATDLDVSPGAFGELAAMASGRVDVTWAWLVATATSSSAVSSTTTSA